MCYAFYPKDEKKQVSEELQNHLQDVVNDISKNKIFPKLYKKISKLLNIDEKIVHDIILLTGLLHDIGKALEKYQKKPSEGFSGHFVYSSLIIYTVLLDVLAENNKNIIQNNDTAKYIKYLLIDPILLHHYAGYNDLIESFNKTIKSDKKEGGEIYIEFNKPCLKILINLFSDFQKYLCSNFGKEILDKLTILFEDYSDRAKIKIYLTTFEQLLPMSSEINREGKLKSSLMAITGILNEADGTIARKNRSKNIDNI